jgi:hypothetical protein
MDEKHLWLIPLFDKLLFQNQKIQLLSRILFLVGSYCQFSDEKYFFERNLIVFFARVALLIGVDSS